MFSRATSDRAETRRQRALDQLNLHEGEVDAKIDAIVAFARRAFRADAAVFSVIDGNRQWNKSRSGTDVFEVPRAHSFCSYTILESGAFIIPDAIRDPRFAGNPAVLAEPRVRFYAGYPVEMASGERIGAVCVIGREARAANDIDIVMLRELALMVEQELPRLIA